MFYTCFVQSYSQSGIKWYFVGKF
ncbi:MAG: hypothetical protein HOH13_02540 [Crocinitomicaceae bacterium]|nr:hypothetical protein [Crocinitomicaceae bacterium]MBT6514387.1 hypothetical protein [Crocinitomicaceae bacterium]